MAAKSMGSFAPKKWEWDNAARAKSPAATCTFTTTSEGAEMRRGKKGTEEEWPQKGAKGAKGLWMKTRGFWV